MTTIEQAARASLIDSLNEELIDVITGPLSDTEFVDAVIEDDGILSLHKVSIQTLPDGSFDTSQLADAVLRWLAEHLLSDEAVERAAEAIHNSPPSSLACASAWDQHSDVTKEDYRRYARAALSAALGTNHMDGSER